jgi:nitrate reductase assembly molybdenum cofactor insertion protein NarJ
MNHPEGISMEPVPAASVDQKSVAAVLASLVASYPRADFAADVGLLLEAPELTLSDELRALLREALADPVALDRWRSDYIDLFDRGASRNPVHETEWARDRSLGKATELADIAGFYRAFGVELGGDGLAREMADHLAVELEFYGILLLKERYLLQVGDEDGVAIVRDARRKFLQCHLGTFAGAVATLPDVAGHPVFGPVFRWCADQVAADCLDLGANPVAVTRPDGAVENGGQEEGGTCCGALGRSLA